MAPWFSVIVPVYNVEKYLDRCVQSLLTQSCQNMEIILVDDGSTDSSGRICSEYAEKYEHIAVIHKPNGGLASARNSGMEAASGKYLVFVDSDDWIDSETLEILYDHSKKTDADILNYGYKKIRDGQVGIREHAVFPEGLYDQKAIQSAILPDSVARERAFDPVNLPVQLSACMCTYRRGFLTETKIRFVSEREVLCEDWLFNISCLCSAKTFVVLHNCFYNYDTRYDSLSMSYKSDAYQRRRKLYECYWEVLENTGNLNDVIRYRLKNFWLESVYCCYIIELLAPNWTENSREKLLRLCQDREFREFMSGLNRKNCTAKGLVFRLAVRARLHGLIRMAYLLKKYFWLHKQPTPERKGQ